MSDRPGNNNIVHVIYYIYLNIEENLELILLCTTCCIMIMNINHDTAGVNVNNHDTAGGT